MKKLITIIALTFSIGLWAEMKPLLKYLDEQGELSNGSMLYIHYRCLGLYGMVTNVTSGSTDKNSQAIASTVGARSVKLLEDTFVVWSLVREDKSIEAFQENLKRSVQPLADNYQILANDNWINNGAYFEGNELLLGDLTVCGQLAEVRDENN
tara:strand:+ start:141 stop:599 length:459 start_codon:yes stop_codon:yes gene_type:complete